MHGSAQPAYRISQFHHSLGLLVTVFTRSQLDHVWAALDAWNGKPTELADRQAIEMSASLTVADSPALSWDGLNVENDNDRMCDQLQNVLTQIRCRMASYL